MHDCWGGGLQTTAGFFTTVVDSLFCQQQGNRDLSPERLGADARGDAELLPSSAMARMASTSPTPTLSSSLIQDNIIKDHTGAGKYGIKTGSGTTASNDRMQGLTCRNWFHNNTADALNLTVGALYGDSTSVDGLLFGRQREGAITGAAAKVGPPGPSSTPSRAPPPTSHQKPWRRDGAPPAASMIIVGM